MIAPPRHAWLHVPVVQLQVAAPWRVGRVEFRPAGALADLVTTRRALSGKEPGYTEFMRQGVETNSKAAMAVVRVPWPDEDFNAQEAIREHATEQVRDALAVLRLYKRVRYPMVPMDVQEFGLHGDIGSVMQWTTTTRGRRVIAGSSRWLGIIGDWSFTAADAQEYLADPRFAYLDQALRRPIRRSELERRALTALRVRALSTAMLRPQLQVILLATALEALLAEEPPAGSPRPLGEFYRITRRALYLTCGRPDHGYPSRRPCFYLEAKSQTAMEHSFMDRARLGQRPWCSAFINVYGLMQDRHEALHLARERFERRQLITHRVTADEVILDALAWATSRGARKLVELDAELEAFVKGGKAVVEVGRPVIGLSSRRQSGSRARTRG